MAESSEWCRGWQPPPLPPRGSELFQQSFSYIRNNATHWENYKTYFRLCNLTLPVPEETTPPPGTTTVSQTTQIAVQETTDGPRSTVPTETHQINETTDVPQITIPTETDQINVGKDHVAVYVIIALLIVLTVIVIALCIWCKVKKKRARANIASLPLKEYESTNYLDNKARNNQCWNNQVQEPCQSNDSDKDQGFLTISAKVEPISGTIVNEVLVSESLMNLKNSSDTKVGDAGYQNICFKNENEGQEKELPKSPDVDSTSPLFDDIDGGLLPNVPQNNDSVTSEKKGNEYEPFSVVFKSGQLPPIHGGSEHQGSTGSSQKKRRKRTTSLIKRTSEPVTNVGDIREDLVENRKSV